MLRTALVAVVILAVIGTANGIEETLNSADANLLPKEVRSETILADILNEKPVSYDSVTVTGLLDLGSLDHPINKTIRITNSNIKNMVSFQNAIIEEAVDFSGTSFGGEVNFFNTIFLNASDFRGCQFSENANFGGSKFLKKGNFESAKFDNDVIFGATEINWPRFTWAKFGNEAYFGGAKFENKTDFAGAQFGKDANFENVSFLGNTFFSFAKFSEDASFMESNFSRNAYFRQAQFNGKANLRDTEFGGNSTFDEAKFGGEVNFRNAKFSGDAWFGKSLFAEESDFRNVTFAKIASFTEAVLNKEARFEDANFGSIFQLNKTEFNRLDAHWSAISGHMDPNYFDKKVYTSLFGNYKNIGWLLDAGNCYYDYKERERNSIPLALSKPEDVGRLANKFMSTISWLSCGYGVRPYYTVICIIILIIIFGFIYKISNGVKIINASEIDKSPVIYLGDDELDLDVTLHGNGISLKDALYYSAMTFIFRNPGNFAPHGPGVTVSKIERWVGKFLYLGIFLVFLNQAIQSYFKPPW